jgi:hypothetical protein
MQWIRTHLSFANAISMIALFVALGGTSIAAVSLSKNSVGSAQVKKNSLKAADIGRNAVGASEIRSNSVRGGDVGDGSIGSLDIGDNAIGGGELGDNAVGSGELRDNSVGSSELGDNSVGSGELGDNSVGSGEVTDNGLNANDIDGATLDGEIGPDAFARVGDDAGRTLEPNDAGFAPQVKGISQPDVVPGEGGAATGTTCFNLPTRPASAMVVVDNADAAANNDRIASIAIDRGEDLGDCPASHNDARVRIVDTDITAGGAEQDPGPVNARFFVWFEL